MKRAYSANRKRFITIMLIWIDVWISSMEIYTDDDINCWVLDSKCLLSGDNRTKTEFTDSDGRFILTFHWKFHGLSLSQLRVMQLILSQIGVKQLTKPTDIETNETYWTPIKIYLSIWIDFLKQELSNWLNLWCQII